VFRVLAKSFDIGSPSTQLEVMPASTPAAPNQPTVTASSSSQITIEWTQDADTNGGSDIFDYIVYWNDGITDNQEVVAETTTNLLTYTTTDVSAGTYYTFWVAAKNFVGTGLLSEPTTQLAASVPDKPDAPSVTATHDTVSLTWQAPSNGGVSIDDYDIYWDSDGNASDDFSFLTTTTDLFHTINSGVV
jgi:hypothetical protein